MPLIYLLRFINQLGRIIFIPILPLFILSLIHNPDKVNSTTGIIMGASSAATAIFSIFLGRMGDRSDHRMIVLCCLASSCLSFFMQSFVHTDWHLMWLQVLYGAALGGTVTGISALLANHTPIGSEGAVYGLDNAVNAAARVIGPMLGVAILSWKGPRMVFGTAALLYLIATLLAAARLFTLRKGSG
jgi:DHA1 family multidrug resistance protein-like MFS transporter